jgi:predicted nucleic acid-binding protein
MIDTSAWAEFLHDTGSTVCARVDELVGGEIAVCEPVRMEVLAGAGDERHLNDLRRLLARGTLVPTEATDYEEAAALYRVCRRSGATVRKMIDSLIASVAIRADTPVLHMDTDFDVLARHTPLRFDRPRSRH